MVVSLVAICFRAWKLWSFFQLVTICHWPVVTSCEVVQAPSQRGSLVHLSGWRGWPLNDVMMRWMWRSHAVDLSWLVQDYQQHRGWPLGCYWHDIHCRLILLKKCDHWASSTTVNISVNSLVAIRWVTLSWTNCWERKARIEYDKKQSPLITIIYNSL